MFRAVASDEIQLPTITAASYNYDFQNIKNNGVSNVSLSLKKLNFSIWLVQCLVLAYFVAFLKKTLHFTERLDYRFLKYPIEYS